ncbi:hypothetical protein C2G38_2173230 [Gigaspora rosea]|uniref:Uncharacterized protein n=1 Tax=Gigaspora rosea TaxID=44941 RepID=A0A397VLI4_9GLOM|nr:hypothetical protein C2G38_2173230 [Gigaspora rosea]
MTKSTIKQQPQAPNDDQSTTKQQPKTPPNDDESTIKEPQKHCKNHNESTKKNTTQRRRKQQGHHETTMGKTQTRLSYFLTTPYETWDALEYHEEWRASKHPMNKEKLIIVLYKQLDWFKNAGSDEEKKASERILKQFKMRSHFCKLYGSCGKENITVLEWRWTMVLLAKILHELTKLANLIHSQDSSCTNRFIYDFWAKAIAKKQADLQESKIDAKVRTLKAEQRLTIATVTTEQVEQYALSTTFNVHTKQRAKKRPTYTEPITDVKEFEQKDILFFEPSEISKIQEMNMAYTGFLTTDKISDIRSHAFLKFKIIEISNGVKEYVKENKKDYQQCSLEEIESFLNTKLGIKLVKSYYPDVFRLLEECVLWDSLVNMDELTEGTIDVRSYISKLCCSRGRIPDCKLNNRNGTLRLYLAKNTREELERRKKCARVGANLTRAKVDIELDKVITPYMDRSGY